MNEIFCEGNSFNDLYVKTFYEMSAKSTTSAPRGLNVYEVSPAILILKNPRDRLLQFNEMRNIKRYCYGEALWYLSGSDSLEFISKYSKFWNKISDDGKTCNSAYGKYIFKHLYSDGEHLINQWDYVKQTLRKDSMSRQALIHIKPIQTSPTKDVVCTTTLQFMIREGKLDLIVNMRSNDFIKGLTYDVFQFTLLQELMAVELGGIKLGRYVHIANNLHLYESDTDMVTKMIASGVKRDYKLLPKIPKNFRCVDLPLLLAGMNPISHFAEEFKKYESDS